jgi:hypothetical protein
MFMTSFRATTSWLARLAKEFKRPVLPNHGKSDGGRWATICGSVILSCRFHRDGIRAPVFSLSRIAFSVRPLASPGPKIKIGSGVAEMGNDLVVEARQMPGRTPSGANHRTGTAWYSKRPVEGSPERPELPFPAGLYPALFLPRFWTGRR